MRILKLSSLVVALAVACGAQAQTFELKRGAADLVPDTLVAANTFSGHFSPNLERSPVAACPPTRLKEKAAAAVIIMAKEKAAATSTKIFC